MRKFATIFFVSVILFGCGEPYRQEGRQYAAAANVAIDEYFRQSGTGGQHEKPYWNDCGSEVTCLYLYSTQDKKLVEAVVISLLSAQDEIKKPGIKLTVYSSSHDEPKVLFREITIK